MGSSPTYEARFLDHPKKGSISLVSSPSSVKLGIILELAGLLKNREWFDHDERWPVSTRGRKKGRERRWKRGRRGEKRESVYWLAEKKTVSSSERNVPVLSHSAVSPSLKPHGCKVALQAPLSMYPSRQNYWRRLPFPTPGHLPDPGIESVSLTPPTLTGGFHCATWEAPESSNSHQQRRVKVAQSYPTLCDPVDYTVHGILQARILEWVAFPFSRSSPQPGIKPRSPALQAYSLPAEPQGKMSPQRSSRW